MRLISFRPLTLSQEVGPWSDSNSPVLLKKEMGFLFLEGGKNNNQYQETLGKRSLLLNLSRQAQISILEIFHIFLWLKFSPSLILNKIERFSKVSSRLRHKIFIRVKS
jgi:hypothetical protein